MPNEKKNIYILFHKLVLFRHNYLPKSPRQLFSILCFRRRANNQFAVSIIHLVFSNHEVIAVAFAQLEQARNFLECETSCACSYSDSISITHSKTRGREGGAEEPSIRAGRVPVYLHTLYQACFACTQTQFTYARRQGSTG